MVIFVRMGYNKIDKINGGNVNGFRKIISSIK